MIPLNAMESLYTSSIGEGFQRGGYEFILIKEKMNNIWKRMMD